MRNQSIMLKPMKLGFIGGSIYSAIGYSHAVACTMDNNWSIEAGCFDEDIKLNLETARKYGVAPKRVYDNWSSLMKKEKGSLDAIVVLTPTPSHYEIVMAGLSEKIPIVCEKSLVMSSTEAKAIYDFCYRVNGFVAVTYNYSGYPMVRELRNMIRKGNLGKILHFQAEMPQEGFLRVDAQGNTITPQTWRLTDGRLPIIHLDLAAHLHHLIYYLLGQKPIEVVSDQRSYGCFPGVIDNVTALCRYSENIQGQIWFSKSALGNRNGLRLRIYGSNGAAEWYQGCPEELLISYKNGQREKMDRASGAEVASKRRYNRFKAGHPAGFLEAFANLYDDLADSLCQYKQTGRWCSDEVFSVELALEGLQLFEAMVESVKTRKWQAVTCQK